MAWSRIQHASTHDGDEGWDAHLPAPGKRMLTDRLQRRAAGTTPLAATSTTAVQRLERNGLSCDQSFLDSILHGPVQRRADGEAANADVPALAAQGTSGTGEALPYLDRIQASFGAHDVSHVQAHTDAAASEAARGMGAHAFATGDHVAFAGAPDLHTAAHEAAHVVQQRAGVHLKGGVGEEGDRYEQHADAVADRVVRGDSAEELLSAYLGPGVQQQTTAVRRSPGKETAEGSEVVGADAGVRGDATQDLVDFFMGPAPAAASTAVQLKPQRAASADAMPANVLDAPADLAFDTIYRLADEALMALENVDREEPDHAKRDAIVDEYGAQIAKAATAATQLVQQIPWHRREIFYVRADMAAERVLAVMTWIMSRTGNARMRSRFEQAVRVVDGALRSLSRDPVTAHHTPALRGKESFEADDEKKDLLQAQQDHAIALRDLRDAKIIRGIEPFDDLAALEDNPQPSFIVEIAKAVLVATLGHLAGGALGLAMKSIGKGGREALSRMSEHFKNVTIDSVQGIGAEAADQALADTNKDKNAKSKARTFFVAGLKSAVGKEQSQHEQLISIETRDGIATAASIRAETATLRAMEKEIGAIYLQRASAGWASYLAQHALGKTGSHDPSGRQASNMKNFLGEPQRDADPTGDRVIGSGKARTDGVLHLHLEIDADARRGPKATIRRKGRVTIDGVNDDLREQILAEAGGHIARVWLPKVIYVSMAGNSFQAARLAFDERNVLRDHTEWSYIALHTQHVADRAYDSPQAFAKHLVTTELA